MTTAQRLYLNPTQQVGASVRTLAEAASAGTTLAGQHQYNANGWKCFRPYVNSGTGVSAVAALPSTSAGFGWRLPAAVLGGVADGKRYVPAGTWQFDIQTVTNTTALLTNGTARLAVNVFRVLANGTIGELLGQGVSADISASNTATTAVRNASVVMPEVVFEPGETLQFEIWAYGDFSAGVLGVGAYNTVVRIDDAAATTFDVSAPGIRTSYARAMEGVGRGGGVLRTLVRKQVEARANGGGSFNRKWEAFRVQEAVSAVAAVHGKLIIAKPMEAVAAVRAVDGLTIVYKKAVLVKAVGVATRTALVRKAIMEAQAEGVGTVARLQDLVRHMTAEGVGVPADLRRVVIFVRQMEAVAAVRIRPRIALDWNDLPTSDGTGGGTTVVRRPVYVFDD